MPAYAEGLYDAEGPAVQPLLTSLCLEYRKRPVRDQFWAVLYLSLVISSLVGSAFAVVNRNPHFDAVAKGDYTSDPTHCPLTSSALDASTEAYSSHGSSLSLLLLRGASAAAQLPQQRPDWRPTFFLKSAGLLAVCSTAASLALSLAFLLALQTSPAVFVYCAVTVQVLAPVVVASLAFSAGNNRLGILFSVVAVALSLSYYFSQDSTALVVRLLGVSAQALRQNASIPVVVVFLNVALLGLLACLSCGAAAAVANGSVLPNPRRMPGATQCTDASGVAVTCCVWVPLPLLAPLLVPAAAVAAAWSVLLAFQIKVFTISGCVAQWYFAPAGMGGQPQATLRSLRHAATSSLGSLCLAALLTSATCYFRCFVMHCCRSSRSSDGGNAASAPVSLLGCGCSAVVTIVQQLSKFSVVRMAMTGAGFWSSGRDAASLLARHVMDGYSAWGFPPVVLFLASTALSSAWACCIYYGALLAWGVPGSGASDLVAWQSALALSALSGLLAFVALQYLCGVVLNVMDAIFVCYAVDRDHESCSRLDVHEVFSQLPGSHPAQYMCGRGGAPPTSSHASYTYYALDRCSSMPTLHPGDASDGPPFVLPNPQPYHSFSAQPRMASPELRAQYDVHRLPGEGGDGQGAGTAGRPPSAGYPGWGVSAGQAHSPARPGAAAVPPRPAYYMAPPPPQYSRAASSYDVVPPFQVLHHSGSHRRGTGEAEPAPSAPPARRK